MEFERIKQSEEVLAIMKDAEGIGLRLQEAIKNLLEVKNINPRNREEVFFIDLTDGRIYDRDLKEVGRASINKRKKIITIKTTYVERLNFSDVKQGFFKTK